MQQIRITINKILNMLHNQQAELTRHKIELTRQGRVLTDVQKTVQELVDTLPADPFDPDNEGIEVVRSS